MNQTVWFGSNSQANSVSRQFGAFQWSQGPVSQSHENRGENGCAQIPGNMHTPLISSNQPISLKTGQSVVNDNIQKHGAEAGSLKDVSNPKVVRSANTPQMVSVTSPASPTPSGSVPKDTPRPSKEPAEPSRRSSYPEDDVHSSAPTPCANSLMIGKRPSRQREAAIKRRRTEWVTADESDEEEEVGACEKEKVLPDTRFKGPCSYHLCPNPTHSSGGGFKIVTQDTKAGHRSWSRYVGRVFCNACFTQYATRGTFERPGRQYGPSAAASETKPLATAATAPSSDGIVLSREASRESFRARPELPTVPLYRPVPCAVDVRELVEVRADLRRPHTCVELSVAAAGPNLKFQWLRDGLRIPGATERTLVLFGPDQCRGNISCRLTNDFGSAPLFTPVRLPLTPEQALHKYGDNSLDCPPGPGESPLSRERQEATVFRLHCVCGKVTTGSPAELATVPCQCGRICCGRTWPVSEDQDGLVLDTKELGSPLGLLDIHEPLM